MRILVGRRTVRLLTAPMRQSIRAAGEEALAKALGFTTAVALGTNHNMPPKITELAPGRPNSPSSIDEVPTKPSFVR